MRFELNFATVMHFRDSESRLQSYSVISSAQAGGGAARSLKPRYRFGSGRPKVRGVSRPQWRRLASC